MPEVIRLQFKNSVTKTRFFNKFRNALEQFFGHFSSEVKKRNFRSKKQKIVQSKTQIR